jgi:hypothetical protein
LRDDDHRENLEPVGIGRQAARAMANRGQSRIWMSRPFWHRIQIQIFLFTFLENTGDHDERTNNVVEELLR